MPEVRADTHWLARVMLGTLIAVGIILALGDILTTFVAIEWAGGYESQLVARVPMELVGTKPALIIGFVVRVGIVGGLGWACLHRPERIARWSAAGLLTVAIGWWTLIVGGNLAELLSA